MKAAIGSRHGSPSHFKTAKVHPLASLGLVALGAGMIWLGPSLSGFGALHGAWCTASNPNALTQITNFAWQATQHCPYCYIGAALIAFGIFGADLGRVKSQYTPVEPK